MNGRQTHNMEIGKRAEDAVLSVMLGKGFSLIDRNFRAGRVGELDLVLSRKSCLYVVEVKSREEGGNYGGAIFAITPVKKMRIQRSTAVFLKERQIYGYDIVFLAGCVTHTSGGVITNVQILPI